MYSTSEDALPQRKRLAKRSFKLKPDSGPNSPKSWWSDCRFIS